MAGSVSGLDLAGLFGPGMDECDGFEYCILISLGRDSFTQTILGCSAARGGEGYNPSRLRNLKFARDLAKLPMPRLAEISWTYPVH